MTYSLLEAYSSLKDRNPVLAARMLEEARWGLSFIIGCRFGDGFRASSMGLLIWQDGIIGTFDDITSVRVQNNAFDNFLYSGYEAFAALTLPDTDKELKVRLRDIAEEDFRFAAEKFAKDGYDKFSQPYEHTYNTSRSQFQATVSWAASQLYRLTGKEKYASRASKAIEYVLSCQRTEPVGDCPGGFFYRDTIRRAIVHYIHQSRDQVFMQALALLCQTQKDSPDYDRWLGAIRLHGDYLKSLMRYTAPYGMIPSGVYETEEWRDTESFHALHLFPPEDATERYSIQIRKGMRLDENPFGQSLIYGEGHNYPQMDSFSSGEITGEMPVGTRTLGDKDIPYWPQTNNACYKEVWVTTAGKWLSLLSEFQE